MGVVTENGDHHLVLTKITHIWDLFCVFYLIIKSGQILGFKYSGVNFLKRVV